MTENTDNARPTSFIKISILALVFNLLLLFAYLGDAFMSPDDVANFFNEERAYYGSRPAWVIAAFALAAHAGVLGSLALIFKKAWAVPLFAIALVGIFLQQLHLYWMSDAAWIFSTAGFVIMFIIFATTVFLFWFSLSAKKKGWIS